jgi:hypothetical protein
VLLGDFLDHALHGLAVGHVAGAGLAGPALARDLGGKAGQLLGVARDGDDVAPIGGQALGDGPADASAGSRDDGDSLVDGAPPACVRSSSTAVLQYARGGTIVRPAAGVVFTRFSGPDHRGPAA